MIIKDIINNKFSWRKKRQGFTVVLALIIVIVGLVLVAALFNSVSHFAKYFSEYRRTYTDIITASSYIENAKARIVAINIARAEAIEPVLHGIQNQFEDFPAGVITDLRGLLVVSGDIARGEVFEYSKDLNMNGPQIVEVQVFDANYRVEGLADTFPDKDYIDLHPTFLFIGGADPSTMWADAGDYGDNYPGFSKEGAPRGGGGGLGAAHSRYGAYVVRVTIYERRAGAVPRKLRTTEEAFIQVIPFQSTN